MNAHMRFVFFGTPEYVLPILTMIHKTFKIQGLPTPIAAIVTQPPRPTGRKKILEFSAIDEWAHKRNIPKYFDPMDVVRNNVDAEIAVLAAYGSIIPKEVIEHFPHGIINVHPSLLPQFRGASPVQATVATGTLPAVTLMQLDEKLDHGPLISSFKDELHEDDTTEILRKRLFERSAEVLQTLIPAYVDKKVHIKAQNHDEATFTTLIKKEDGYVPLKYIKLALEGKSSDDVWEIPFIKDCTTTYYPDSIWRMHKALTPWPGIWTKITENGQELRLKLLDMECKDNVLELKEVQLEGKNPVPWKQFINSHRVI